MRIFTDSGSDLPKSFFMEQDVHLFPLRVLVDGQEYDDVTGIHTDEIYAAIDAGHQPKTSQVSPEVFYEAFEKLAIDGEEGLYVAFSSALSGTCQTAQMIRNDVMEKYPDLKLTIVDSKCASYGLGMTVRELARMRDLGIPNEELIKFAEEQCAAMEHLFTVGDLNYLAKGGRVSKSSAFVGGLLNIKPILNVSEGRLVPLEKTRGFKKAIARMIDIMKERGGDFTGKTVGISHSNDEELMFEVKAAIEEKLSPRAIETTTIGAVIGAHVGKGTIGIYFTNK